MHECTCAGDAGRREKRGRREQRGGEEGGGRGRGKRGRGLRVEAGKDGGVTCTFEQLPKSYTPKHS